MKNELKVINLEDVDNVVIDNALTVYTTPQGLDPHLKQVKDLAEEFKKSRTIETAKGRKEITSFAYKIAKLKTRLDSIGKELSAKQKEIPKKIDAERARAKKFLEDLQADVKEPLVVWEKKEQARKDRMQTMICDISALKNVMDNENSSAIQARINTATDVDICEFYPDYRDKAEHAKTDALHYLKAKLAHVEAQEAKERELEKLRKELEEQEKLRKEQERIAAQQKEEQERILAAERAKIDAENAEIRRQKEEIDRQRAEQERKDAEEWRKIEEERANCAREMVTITKVEYNELCSDKFFLKCLLDRGLDNWINYEDAIAECLNKYPDYL